MSVQSMIPEYASEASAPLEGPRAKRGEGGALPQGSEAPAAKPQASSRAPAVGVGQHRIAGAFAPASGFAGRGGAARPA
jgi:hypothetical protein